MTTMFKGGAEIGCHYLQKISAAIFLCLCLASCGQIPWEDMSSNPKYSSVIGKQFKTKKELWALGITNENYAKKVDYILLVPGVGFSGPEVVTREQLTRGSIFRVVGVLKARSLVFSRRTAYIVEEIGSNRFIGHEVRIRLTGNINDQNYGLNESIYALENSVR